MAPECTKEDEELKRRGCSAAGAEIGFRQVGVFGAALQNLCEFMTNIALAC